LGDSKKDIPATSAPPKIVELVPGQIVSGRYKIRRRIGQGGMGAVYAAEHVEFGRHVALKVLAPELSQQQDMLTRFRGEARAASQIGHPGIIDVFDFGTTEDGCVFFAMELLEGEDVAQVLARERRIGVARASRIIAETAAAVGAAHGKGIVHRDLKPENIFLVKRNGKESVKVLDFGVAKATDPFIGPQQGVTGRGTVVGTPEYMSPEQASGNPVDARSDVYSLGCILYEMFVGKPPFVGKNFVTVLMKHIGQPPVPPREHDPPADIPPALEKVIMKALAKDPTQRYASMEEMARSVVQASAEPDARGDDPVWLPQEDASRVGRSSVSMPAMGLADPDTVTTDPVEKIDSAELPRVDSNEKTQVPAEARRKSVAPGTSSADAPSAEPQSPPATGSKPGRTTNPGEKLRKTNPPTMSPIGRPTPAPTRLTPREISAMRGRSHTPHLGPEVTQQIQTKPPRLTLIHALFALAIAILMVALVLLLKK
jgi:serine/threonine-protein kinase